MITLLNGTSSSGAFEMLPGFAQVSNPVTCHTLAAVTLSRASSSGAGSPPPGQRTGWLPLIAQVCRPATPSSEASLSVSSETISIPAIAPEASAAANSSAGWFPYDWSGAIRIKSGASTKRTTDAGQDSRVMP